MRPKGVTEKCSFCTQRIRQAHDRAKDENREILDGEVIPACAQTCPSEAILFGNIEDAKSAVARIAKAGNAYRIFEHLGTDPSIYYLPKKREGEA